jgi:tellurite resistance protein TerC
MQRWLPVTSDMAGGRLTAVSSGRRLATPLLPALVAVEVSDVVFAVGSIPAIIAVTLDPFIVFTSNVFALLGLRSLYFVLAGVIPKFSYLKVGLSVVLSVVLVFGGAKMLLADLFTVPIGISLGAIVLILGVSVLASLGKAKQPTGTPQEEPVHG